MARQRDEADDPRRPRDVPPDRLPDRLPDHSPDHPSEPGPGFDLDRAWHDHRHALLGFAVNALGDRHAAEECVQDTFVRAWRARERFSEERGSCRSWLFAIARHVVVDAVRARARRPVPVADDSVDGLPAGRRPEQEHVEDRIVVAHALAQLSHQHREVLVAVKLEGLAYAELSDRNGVPVATLRTRAYHALRALRAHLEEDDADARPT